MASSRPRRSGRAPQLSGDAIAAISRFPDENPNPVLRVTGDGRLMYANPASDAILATLGIAVGETFPKASLASIRAAAMSRTPFEVGVANGTFEVLAVDVPDFGFVNLYGTDVTARKAIVKFPDQNPNPVFRLDWQGRIVYANAASNELIAGIDCRVGGTLADGLWTRVRERIEAADRSIVEVATERRIYALLPVDVPEFGFINVYGTDVTAERELARLHRENERLLLNILPEPIAERLRNGERIIADRFDDVTLLFADIVGFTELSSRMAPEELVIVLNEVFTVFDELVDQFGLEKVKTIGDAYMVVGGLTDGGDDHTIRVARMAAVLAERVDSLAAARRLGVFFRVGINCGPVVAGVIGTKKFIYDIWGDTVNLASRMESTGVPGRVQVTAAVEARLRGRFELEARGLVEVKGKGTIPTWFLGSPIDGRAPQSTPSAEDSAAHSAGRRRSAAG